MRKDSPLKVGSAKSPVVFYRDMPSKLKCHSSVQMDSMASHKVYHVRYMEKQKHKCHRARDIGPMLKVIGVRLPSNAPMHKSRYGTNTWPFRTHDASSAQEHLKQAKPEGYYIIYISYLNMDCSPFEVPTLKARCTTTHLCLGFKEKHIEVWTYNSIVLLNPDLC